ncbi:hypothetical protein KHQ81_05010 [Mycoplasmatota bacterium]|nr:hypothetical protein KHQ81_05010 [Mycoplasmatota bacterium]
MNLYKLGLILLLSVGFGFGLSYLDAKALFNNGYNAYHTNHHNWNNESGDYSSHMSNLSMMDRDFDQFIEHMLDNLSIEERLLVEAKIDELLTEYQITLEEISKNDEVMFNFLDNMMGFFQKEEIDHHYFSNGHMC